MGRHSFRLVILAAIAAGALLAGPRLVTLAADFGAGMVAIGAVLIACLCLIVTGVALAKARSAAGEVDRLARTLDAVSRRLDAEISRNRTAIAELSETLAQVRPIESAPSQGTKDETSAFQGNVVPLPITGKKAAQTPAPAPVAALRQFLPEQFSGELTLSLEPIVDVTDHAVTSFEVFAHLKAADGTEHIIRRMDRDGPILEFAASLIDAALLVARRQLRDDAKRMPLHVAVSSEFLADASAAGTVAEAFRINPALAEAVVFSLPPDVFAERLAVKGANVLARHGAIFAAETWPDGADPMGQLATLGVTIVKLAAERLLRPATSKRGLVSGADIVAAAGTQLTVIATGVTSEDDALTLLDLGIGQMSGPAISPLRQVKPTPGSAGASDLRFLPIG